MIGYSRDLRERIASSVEGGHAQGPGGAHLPREPLFGQTLRRQSQQREISCPQEEAGGRPEARQEGHEAARRRSRRTPLPHPPRALRLRGSHDGPIREPLEHVPRYSQDRPHQEKRGAISHRARRVLKGERAGDGGGEGGEPERLVFVDECVLGTPPWRRSTATRPKGERLRLWVPRRRAKNTTLLSSMRG